MDQIRFNFRFVGILLDVNPYMTLVIHDDEDSIVGFAAAALDAKVVAEKLKAEFIPAMCAKYPLSALAEAPSEVQVPKKFPNGGISLSACISEDISSPSHDV